MAMEQESLQEYLDKKQGLTQPGFIVDTDQKADWALRKIAVAKAQQADIKDQAEQEVNRVKQWEKEQTERLEKDTEYFAAMLVSYATRKRENDPKFKTQKLPHGKIGFRKQQPKWEVDKEKSGKWLYENGLPDLVRIKHEPELTKLKKDDGFIVNNGRLVDKATGEFVPGIMVDVREDKPIVEVN
ncbi:host-nuclease inhibitor Gam family protein [Sporolactobacillus terrae]|uniref:host-nuclease inhibitor Gam family protein n=1 Tax=Sporolactobacillus terrae TaxID=269673 RepID=UPI00048D4890|nr:host-nuclease inhibitor Gam family protein [Sporolactobacillus terrae]